MSRQVYPHQEGEIHSVISVDGGTFVIRYGFNDERERETWEPTPIYPDLDRNPVYGVSGRRIVTFMQAPCEHFIPQEEGADRYCGCCKYYERANKQMINPCECEKNKLKSISEKDEED